VPRCDPLLLLCCARGGPLPYKASALDQGANQIGFQSGDPIPNMILCPNSLCAQLLKAKYYLKGDLVDTVFKADASPTWRSIDNGLELLKKGII
jgi:hypothetical protein